MMMFSSGLTRKSFLKYTLLPGLGSRIGALLGPGHANLALLLAHIFNAVGLMPRNHPAFNPDNRWGVFKVIAAARREIEFEWKYADRIFIFAIILTGIALFFLQFAILIASIAIGAADAAGVTPALRELFVTPSPETDLTYRMLFLVFGVDMFAQGQAPFPIHKALYALFEFYSYGILIVGIFILLYFIITIIMETAATGVPFGKRFSHAWAPVRLILFFALIVPISGGLNSGQLITLSAAKYGSSLATNGWIRFNNVATTNYLGDSRNLVAEPSPPEAMHLPAFFMLARTCYWAEKRAHNRDVQAYLIHGPDAADSTQIDSLSYDNALKLLTPDVGRVPPGNIYIRFGVKDPVANAALDGAVSADCGEINLPVNDVSEAGSRVVQEGYYELVKRFWNNDPVLDDFARNYTFAFMSVEPRDSSRPLPDAAYKAWLGENLESWIKNIIADGVSASSDPAQWSPAASVIDYGWLATAVVINKFVENGGAFITSVVNLPTSSAYPLVMEFVRSERLKNDRVVLPEDLYTPVHSDGKAVNFKSSSDREVALVLSKVYQFWHHSSRRTDGLGANAEGTGNSFIDSINAVFGTSALFDICKNTDTHPIAQLAAIGKGLIESSLLSMGYSGLSGILGGSGILNKNFSASLQSFAAFFGIVAGIGLLIGFILFYIIPLMPFIYFFFAIGGWVKSIFEAMVGVPLWALAHLRVDNDNGLAGPAAGSGYFLIFEIFLRPIIIVMGLLASVIIFSAQAMVLQKIFALVVVNVSGSASVASDGCLANAVTGMSKAELGRDMTAQEFIRGPIDEFFFTVVYTILIYMIATASFKLIDTIPNQITRWLNAGVRGFNDDHTPSRGADNIIQQITVGAGALGSQMQKALGDAQKAKSDADGEDERRSVNEYIFITKLREEHNEFLHSASKRADGNLLEKLNNYMQEGRDRGLNEEQMRQRYLSSPFTDEIEKRLAKIDKIDTRLKKLEKFQASVNDEDDTILGRLQQSERKTKEITDAYENMLEGYGIRKSDRPKRTQEARKS